MQISGYLVANMFFKILPNSINYQPPIRTNYAQRIALANGRRMLNALISDAHNRLRIYRQKLHGYRDTVITKTTETDANSLDNAIKQTANAYRTKRHNQLEQKFKTRGPTNNTIATQTPGLKISQIDHSRSNKLAV
jgi:hypothetical protein